MYWKLHFRVTYNPITSTVPPTAVVRLVSTETLPRPGGTTTASQEHEACDRVSTELQQHIERVTAHICANYSSRPFAELITCEPIANFSA
ncbi:MAG: hypothetical protein Q7S96_03195 [bacterium]|nr:hypothetical protein [bacterium]